MSPMTDNSADTANQLIREELSRMKINDIESNNLEEQAEEALKKFSEQWGEHTVVIITINFQL